MRILYLSSKKNWGGVTNWLNRTSIGLEHRGHRVWVIAHPDGRFIKTADPSPIIVSKKLGMDYNPWSILFLRRFIIKNRIELIVTNIEKEIMAGGIASRMCRIPNVRRVGREDDFNEKFRVKWHHRLLVDRSITPCNLIRDNALKRAPWLDGSKFTTIYNGRNLEQFSNKQVVQQKKAWGLSGADFVVGVTSQLSKVKNIDLLIHTFARLVQKAPHCHLVITGEGPERNHLERLSMEIGVADRVIFAGYSADALLAAASYDIAVSTSRFEGFPNTIVEYFAAGRPVVSSDAGGITEMVKHGYNGLLFPCGDERKLYESLLQLVGNDGLRETLRQNAINTIKENYSEDIMLDRLEGFFSDTIKNLC